MTRPQVRRIFTAKPLRSQGKRKEFEKVSATNPENPMSQDGGAYHVQWMILCDPSAAFAASRYFFRV
jgi:hypothetical protein